jgi:hypothetical protein
MQGYLVVLAHISGTEAGRGSAARGDLMQFEKPGKAARATVVSG